MLEKGARNGSDGYLEHPTAVSDYVGGNVKTIRLLRFTPRTAANHSGADELQQKVRRVWQGYPIPLLLTAEIHLMRIGTRIGATNEVRIAASTIATPAAAPCTSPSIIACAVPCPCEIVPSANPRAKGA